jgi:hypothetical protein
MPGPKELCKAEFNPQSLEEDGKTANKVVSSKKVDEPGNVEKPPRSTRAARPSSGRSGSDSNASGRSRGN